MRAATYEDRQLWRRALDIVLAREGRLRTSGEPTPVVPTAAADLLHHSEVIDCAGNVLFVELPPGTDRRSLDAETVATLHHALEELSPGRRLAWVHYGEDPVSYKFHPDYTFDRFLMNSADRTVVETVLDALESSIGHMIVLVVGASGNGKTHFLQAAGHAMRAVQPSRAPGVVYSTAEDFLAQCLEAPAHTLTRSQIAHYGDADLLLLDDLHNLGGSEGAQRQLERVVDRLSIRGGLLVCSADRSVDRLELTDGLREKLQHGQEVRLPVPDLPTRLELVRRFAADQKAQLDEAVILNLASSECSSFRRLQSMVRQVVTGDGTRVVRPTPEEVQRAVADYYEIPLADMLSLRRDRPIVRARQLAMWVCRADIGLSFPLIAAAFGRDDHTVAIYAWDRISALLKHDTAVQADLVEVRRALTARGGRTAA